MPPTGCGFPGRRPHREWLPRDAGTSSFWSNTSRVTPGWRMMLTRADTQQGFTRAHFEVMQWSIHAGRDEVNRSSKVVEVATGRTTARRCFILVCVDSETPSLRADGFASLNRTGQCPATCTYRRRGRKQRNLPVKIDVAADGQIWNRQWLDAARVRLPH